MSTTSDVVPAPENADLLEKLPQELLACILDQLESPKHVSSARLACKRFALAQGHRLTSLQLPLPLPGNLRLSNPLTFVKTLTLVFPAEEEGNEGALTHAEALIPEEEGAQENVPDAVGAAAEDEHLAAANADDMVVEEADLQTGAAHLHMLAQQMSQLSPDAGPAPALGALQQQQQVQLQVQAMDVAEQELPSASPSGELCASPQTGSAVSVDQVPSNHESTAHKASTSGYRPALASHREDAGALTSPDAGAAEAGPSGLQQFSGEQPWPKSTSTSSEHNMPVGAGSDGTEAGTSGVACGSSVMQASAESSVPRSTGHGAGVVPRADAVVEAHQEQPQGILSADGNKAMNLGSDDEEATGTSSTDMRIPAQLHHLSTALVPRLRCLQSLCLSLLPEDCADAIAELLRAAPQLVHLEIVRGARRLCEDEDAMWDAAASLSSLQHLTLKGGILSECDTRGMVKLTGLTHLKVSGTVNTSPGLYFLSRLSRLTHLVIEDLQYDNGAIYDEFCGLSHLTALESLSFLVVGPLPGEVTSWSSLSCLTRFEITNHYDENLLPCLGGLLGIATRLVQLNLTNFELNRTLLGALEHCTAIQDLSAARLNLAAQDMEALGIMQGGGPGTHAHQQHRLSATGAAAAAGAGVGSEAHGAAGTPAAGGAAGSGAAAASLSLSPAQQQQPSGVMPGAWSSMHMLASPHHSPRAPRHHYLANVRKLVLHFVDDLQATEVSLGVVFPCLEELVLSTRYTVSFEAVARIPTQLFSPDAPLTRLTRLQLYDSLMCSQLVASCPAVTTLTLDWNQLAMADMLPILAPWVGLRHLTWTTCNMLADEHMAVLVAQHPLLEEVELTTCTALSPVGLTLLASLYHITIITIMGAPAMNRTTLEAWVANPKVKRVALRGCTGITQTECDAVLSTTPRLELVITYVKAHTTTTNNNNHAADVEEGQQGQEGQQQQHVEDDDGIIIEEDLPALAEEHHNLEQHQQEEQEEANQQQQQHHHHQQPQDDELPVPPPPLQQQEEQQQEEEEADAAHAGWEVMQEDADGHEMQQQ